MDKADHRIGNRIRNSVKCDYQFVLAILGTFTLVTWCIIILLPSTPFERFLSGIILPPLDFTPLATSHSSLSSAWKHAFQGGILERGLVIELVCFIVLGYVIWRYRILTALTTGSIPARLMLGALLSFALMLFSDLLTSKAFPYPFGEPAQYILLLAFILAFALKANSRWWKFLLCTILVCSVLQSLWALLLYSTGHGMFRAPGIIPRATGTMGNPVTLYPVCLISILLILALAVGETSAWLRLLYLVSSVPVAISLLLTFSRSGGLGIAVGTIWLAYTERRSKWLKVTAAFAVTLMCIMLFARANTWTGELGMDRSALGRIHIWRTSTKIIRDNWLLGTGYMAYRDVQKEYIDEEFKKFNPRNVSPQNLLLTIQAYHGIFGTGVLLLFVYAIWAVCRGESRGNYTPWEWRMRSGIKAAGLAIIAASLIDTPLYSHLHFPGTFMWLVCMGFLLHLEVRDHHPVGEWRYAKLLRRVSLSVLTLAVIGIGYVVTFAIVDAHRASKALDAKLAEARSIPGFVTMEHIPKAMEECVIAEEDLHFNLHHGYSLVDMHRALRVNIRSGRVKQGGSTVTQQLGKNLFFSRDRTPRRKIAEIIMAAKLENELSKKEILEVYLNTIEYGLGSRGIDEAAHIYFGKDASKLTDAECALLTGFIPSPPKEALTLERARSAIHLTLSRLKHANPSRWISVQDELDEIGEDAWLKKHMSL